MVPKQATSMPRGIKNPMARASQLWRVEMLSVTCCPIVALTSGVRGSVINRF